MLQRMAMTCPPEWQDKSMLILSAPKPGGSGVTANMVVTHVPAPAGLPVDPQARLNAMVDAQVAQMKDQLAGFREVSRRVEAAGEGAMVALVVEWHNAQARLTQSLFFVRAPDDGFIVATGTAGRDDHADEAPRFADMLKSFRLAD